MRRKSIFKKQQVESARHCHAGYCGEAALYPAPNSRPLPKSYSHKDYIHDDEPTERKWYCLEHIREFNASWDFFSGMSESEIEAFRKDAVTGHRETHAIGPKAIHREQGKINKAYEDAWKFKMGFEYIREREEEVYNEIPESEMKAMHILGISYPTSKKDLKKRYHELVKLYHPDKNGGKKGEEKLKIINQAYTLLK